MRKRINGNRNVFLMLFIILSCFSLTINAQIIKGKVTASRVPVKDASITFIDETDTTKKFFALSDATGNYQIDILTSVGNNPDAIPANFELNQNYPNPFSSSTVIPYQLNTQSDIHVNIYDILGRVVKNFTVGIQNAGSHRILWDGNNNFGQKVATGVYFYQLKVGNDSQIKKMIYNAGVNNGSIALQSNYSSSLPKPNKNANENIQDGNYTIRLENTDNTTPLIVSQQIENVPIQNDTTINFAVTYIPSATINFDSLHQYIRGFGAANIVGWRPDMTDSEIETAFGTGDGQLGFSILRFRISPDKNSWNVNVSTAKKVYDKGVLLFASPWSPPASMKTNNSLVGGELKESSYADYATHLNEFAEYMSNNGAPMYAVSIQNEPDITVTYESCDWTPEQMIKFLAEQGPLINTKIIAPESFQFRRNMSDPILNDSAAFANLDIVGGHIYGGGLASYPLAEEKGKEIWMTEHLTESDHSGNIWSLALDVAEEINDVMAANMSAYVWWYIVRYYGPIGDGEKSTSFPNEDFAKKGGVTKKGYVMSQFSRFIRPGFYRVESAKSPSQSKIDVTAYKDPASSKTVIVAINNDSKPVEHVFRIQNGTTFTFMTYTTSASKNCEQGSNVNVENGSLTFTLEPSSITTFVSN